MHRPRTPSFHRGPPCGNAVLRMANQPLSPEFQVDAMGEFKDPLLRQGFEMLIALGIATRHGLPWQAHESVGIQCISLAGYHSIS